MNAGDGYNHPQSAHMFTNESGASKFNDLDSQPWHEWWAVQGGHGGAIRNKDYYKLYWDNGTKTGNVKPFLETEANYEDISYGRFAASVSARPSSPKILSRSMALACISRSCFQNFGVEGESFGKLRVHIRRYGNLGKQLFHGGQHRLVRELQL